MNALDIEGAQPLVDECGELGRQPGLLDLVLAEDR